MSSERARRAAQALTILVAIASAAPARADPESEARARFRAGVASFQARDFAAARHAFEEAHHLFPNPRVLANIAACFDREGRPADAVRTYRRFLEEAEDIEPTVRRGAEREIARLRPIIGELVLAIDPPGAEVHIDDGIGGVAPLASPLAVAPGQRLLEVRAPGHAPFSRSLDVAAGQQINLSVVLQPIATAEPPAEPRMEAVPEPPTRPEPMEARPPATTPIGRGPLLWTGIGLTTALAAGATVTGLMVLSSRDEYHDQTTTLERRQELFDSTDTLATITSVLIDAAIGAAIGTLALFLLGGPDDEGDGTTVTREEPR
jgi:hypothetical protein